MLTQQFFSYAMVGITKNVHHCVCLCLDSNIHGFSTRSYGFDQFQVSGMKITHFKLRCFWRIQFYNDISFHWIGWKFVYSCVKRCIYKTLLKIHGYYYPSINTHNDGHFLLSLVASSPICTVKSMIFWNPYGIPSIKKRHWKVKIIFSKRLILMSQKLNHMGFKTRWVGFL
jgi:hypothetical protein